MTKNESDLDRAIRAGISVTALGHRPCHRRGVHPVGIALFGVAGMAGATAISGLSGVTALDDLATGLPVSGPAPRTVSRSAPW